MGSIRDMFPDMMDIASQLILKWERSVVIRTIFSYDPLLIETT